MFEGFTLEQQRAIEVERGWKTSWSALTYCTAEGVLFRKTKRAKSLLDYEILDAERTSGAPDCIHKRQGKWGTYVRPTDPTARHTFARALKELFDWEVPHSHLSLVSIVGPWLHKSTMKSDGNNLVLNVLNDQAEATPFEAKLFWTDVSGYEIGKGGSYAKSTTGARWITLRDLIEEQGTNPDYLYWTMIALCVQGDFFPVGVDTQYISPGKYAMR